MGKKPLLGLVGALWVGLAVTGCSETRPQQYRTGPTFGKNTATPPAGTDMTATQTAPPPASQSWGPTPSTTTPVSRTPPSADSGSFDRTSGVRSPYPSSGGMGGVQPTGMSPPAPPPSLGPTSMDNGRMGTGAGMSQNPYPTPTADQQANKFPSGTGTVLPPPPASKMTTTTPTTPPAPVDETTAPPPPAPPGPVPAEQGPELPAQSPGGSTPPNG